MKLVKLMLLVGLLQFSHMAMAQEGGETADGEQQTEKTMSKKEKKKMVKMLKKKMKNACKMEGMGDLCEAGQDVKATCKAEGKKSDACKEAFMGFKEQFMAWKEENPEVAEQMAAKKKGKKGGKKGKKGSKDGDKDGERKEKPEEGGEESADGEPSFESMTIAGTDDVDAFAVHF